MSPPITGCMVHIIRHGQAIHNVQRGYPYRDPPLTELGRRQAKAVKPTDPPDLIILSPMTRTIETALLAFESQFTIVPVRVKVQIWSDLREAHDAICNTGVSRADLTAKFPQFDFSECSEEWDYAPHSHKEAGIRAERVRKRLKDLSDSYKHIALITHRGFIAFLVQGERFNVCECRRYRFATEDELESNRYGLNCDTNSKQDFGPSLLVPHEGSEMPVQIASVSEESVTVVEYANSLQ